MSRKRTLSRQPRFVRIVDLDQAGRGIAAGAGRSLRVHGALPGEQVIAMPVRRGRGVDEALVTAVFKAAPEREPERCAHARRCGGCARQHLRPARQLADKQTELLAALAEHGISPAMLAEPVTGPLSGYRHKARMGAKWVPKQGGMLLGFRQKLGARVAVLDACDVLAPVIGQRIGELRILLGGLRARAAIPQVEVAVGDSRAALVLRHLEALDDGDLAALRAYAEASGIAIWLQPAGIESVRPLWPDSGEALTYSLPDFGLTFAFGPLDFTQVNPAVNAKLVNRALDWLEVGGGDDVLDLFCGIGNFSLALATRARSVLGLESNRAAVDQARQNAVRNRIDNATFDALDLFQPGALCEPLPHSHNKWLLDPPRSGAQELVRGLGRNGPERIVYVSCNPGTLARDAGVLVRDKAYRLSRAGIVDMFPHTAHVESIACFDRC